MEAATLGSGNDGPFGDESGGGIERDYTALSLPFGWIDLRIPVDEFLGVLSRRLGGIGCADEIKVRNFTLLP